MAMWNSINISDVRSGFRIDSEFYRSEYIEKDAELAKLKTLPLYHLAKVTDGEHGSVKFIKNGVKYLTAEHVKQGYIDADTARFVSAEVDRRNARASVRAGDVLISIKGTLGEVGLAEENLLPANMNRDVAIIKPFSNSVIGEFITTFLRSRFGEYQLAREGSGGVQQMITLERLRSVRIPSIGDAATKEVASIYQKGLKSRQDSIKLYTQAQQLLESELGLDKLRFDKPVGYTARFSDVTSKNRADADFYQVPFVQIHKHLDSLNTVTLSGLVTLTKGIEVGSKTYSTQGRLFLRVSNITEKGIKVGQSDKYISDESFNTLAKCYQPKIGELLLTKDGTAGTCLVVDEMIDGIISGGIVRLITKSNEIPVEYLALVINSKICRMQVEQECSGALILHWKPSSIRKLRIPLLPNGRMREIAGLALKSKKLQRQSAQLLEQAKFRVEQLIYEAVQA